VFHLSKVSSFSFISVVFGCLHGHKVPEYAAHNRYLHHPFVIVKMAAVSVQEFTKSATTKADESTTHSLLNSRFPVLVPYSEELTVTDQEFATFIASVKASLNYTAPESKPAPSESKSAEPKSRLINALSDDHRVNHDDSTLGHDGMKFTENMDLAHVSASQPIVDAFYDLKGSANQVEKLLNEAWAFDAETTLKIIFNARSIHLGKGDKEGAYKALGWLYQYHPQTLLANLIWLARPVIEKKIKKEPEMARSKEGEEGKTGEKRATKAPAPDDDDFEMVNETEVKLNESATFVLSAADAPIGANTTKNDVKYGVAHGYWKDLANILLLAVNDQLKADGNVTSILNVDGRNIKAQRTREWDYEKAKGLRHEKQDERHTRFEDKLNSDDAFKALHITIARLFASQLRADISALNGQGKRAISFAAKWCPSPAESHDKQTFVVSSIAEVLFPFDDVCPQGTDPTDRTTYLKHARLALRTKILSPLRKHLAIVERDISADTYNSIKYDRVPSLAMERYSSLFLKKDEDRFVGYLERVASGKSRISGAVLLPSTLVKKAKGASYSWGMPDIPTKKVSAIQKLAEMRLLDGQWNTLVKRIKDSGKIESAIAVCDVSGSMSGPVANDGTSPMDSAVGLSLLLAEVVEPPFGGNFITFSEQPVVQKAGGAADKRSFEEKVNYILQSPWGMSTNFVSVFEDLLLPIAVKHKLKQEEMVKQVFVFSDMQFNAASNSTLRWSSSYERIKKLYANAGYDTPELVFWNLADGQKGTPTAGDEPGVSLVSGYSQGMMKMFLDGGLFEDEIVEDVVDEEDKDGDGDAPAVHVEKKVKKDPLATVEKAISHPAYAMLKVVD
jgi:hypothetical protein